MRPASRGEKQPAPLLAVVGGLLLVAAFVGWARQGDASAAAVIKPQYKRSTLNAAADATEHSLDDVGNSSAALAKRDELVTGSEVTPPRTSGQVATITSRLKGLTHAPERLVWPTLLLSNTLQHCDLSQTYAASAWYRCQLARG